MYTPGGQLDSYWLNPYIQGSNSTGVPISTFAQEAEDGTLPFYSFLMCWTGNAPTHDTSMHPRFPCKPGRIIWLPSTTRCAPANHGTIRC